MRGRALGDLPTIIGLTGKRNVGKSTAADMLVTHYGYRKVHVFEGGKHAAERWFEHLTGNVAEADRMVSGDLKDKPHPLLPLHTIQDAPRPEDVGQHASPRYFMEKFGHFMRHGLGVEWTFGMEVARMRRLHGDKVKLVLESVVYESEEVRAEGGIIVRLNRPDFDSPVGVSSDKYLGEVIADHELTSRSLDKLRSNIFALMRFIQDTSDGE